MPYLDHLGALNDALHTEWGSTPRHPSLLRNARLGGGSPPGQHYISLDGLAVYRWTTTTLPGCLALAITCDVWLSEDLRHHGVGAWMRDLRTRAYRRAGFRAELCTVRADNLPQDTIMRRRARPLHEFESDVGGAVRLWLTDLVAAPAMDAVMTVEVQK